MIKKFFLFIFLVALLATTWIAYSIFSLNIGNQDKQTLKVTIDSGMSFGQLTERLSELGFKIPASFKWYATYKEFDRQLQPGIFEVQVPVTVADLIQILSEKARIEQKITILPGWDLRDFAKYLVEKGIAKNEDEVYVLLGQPAEYAIPGISPEKLSWISGKPSRVSLEGYLAPDTYSIYTNATTEEVIDKLLEHRKKQLTPEILEEIKKSGRTMHEIITMASLLEREVRSPKDKAIVADIFWKRHDVNMGLQADSAVHYLTGKEGNVFTSNADRALDNPWNTYKYPGLPPGPISLPNLASIEAALRPTKNDYWYFLTTLDTGEVKYGSTLAEHNANVQKYLRK